jgi:hypothetical protein
VSVVVLDENGYRTLDEVVELVGIVPGIDDDGLGGIGSAVQCSRKRVMTPWRSMG